MRWLALWLVMGVGFAAEEAEELVIVVPKNAALSEIAVKTTELESIRQRVNATLKDSPDGTRARVTLRSVFSDHSAHYGVNAYPYAVVPLNAGGLPDGLETFVAIGINENSGRVERKLPWKDGKRDGEEQVFNAGIVIAVIPWVNDQVHGVRQTFHANGKVLAEVGYVRGAPEGPSRNFDADGRLVSEVMMKAGKRNGVAQDFWPENGQLMREVHYDMGRVIGLTKEFYANGKRKREVAFKNNALHGIEEVYEANGKVSIRRYWLDGEPVSQAEFEKQTKKQSL